MTQVYGPYWRARENMRIDAERALLKSARRKDWQGAMRRLSGVAAKNGAQVREPDGRTVPVTLKWLTGVVGPALEGADYSAKHSLKQRIARPHFIALLSMVNHGAAMAAKSHRPVWFSRKQIEWMLRAARHDDD